MTIYMFLEPRQVRAENLQNSQQYSIHFPIERKFFFLMLVYLSLSNSKAYMTKVDLIFFSYKLGSKYKVLKFNAACRFVFSMGKAATFGFSSLLPKQNMASLTSHV